MMVAPLIFNLSGYGNKETQWSRHTKSSCETPAKTMSLKGNAGTSTVFILSVTCKLSLSIPLTLVVAILQHAHSVHNHAPGGFAFVDLMPDWRAACVAICPQRYEQRFGTLSALHTPGTRHACRSPKSQSQLSAMLRESRSVTFDG